MRALVIGIIGLSLSANAWTAAVALASTSPFDEYGAIKWSDEMARLDNFAILLQNGQNSVGFIVVVDADGGCQGEAKARAQRAKRYVGEHRGIPWNRVGWRVDGHSEVNQTTLLIVPTGASIPTPTADQFR